MRRQFINLWAIVDQESIMLSSPLRNYLLIELTIRLGCMEAFDQKVLPVPFQGLGTLSRDHHLIELDENNPSFLSPFTLFTSKLLQFEN